MPVRGLRPSRQRRAVEKLLEGIGGRLEAFYYALGEDDGYVIADIPDNISAAAVSLQVAATGAVRIRTVPLLSTEEFDLAANKKIEYRPPGT